MLEPKIIPEFMFQPQFLKIYRSLILGKSAQKFEAVKFSSLDVLRNCLAWSNFYNDRRGADLVSSEILNFNNR